MGGIEIIFYNIYLDVMPKKLTSIIKACYKYILDQSTTAIIKI